MGTDSGKVQRTRTYNEYANGQDRQLMIDRRGTLAVQPFGVSATDHGNVFVANVGTATTPISFAKTAYDSDQPQFVIDVPSATTIQLLSVKVVLETEAGTLNEIIWSTSNALLGAGTSTAITPVNAKVDASNSVPGSLTSCYSLYTGNSVAIAGAYEFDRYSQPFISSDGDPMSTQEWSSSNAGWAPTIEGTGAIVCHIVGSTAPTGYLTAVWFETSTS